MRIINRTLLASLFAGAASLLSGCGTLLGVDDYEVDPNFAADDDDDDDDTGDDDTGDDDTGDDDTADDDTADDDTADDDTADDDTGDDDTADDDTADDDTADDDAGDDDTGDDDAGDDDAGDDDAGDDDTADDDIGDDDIGDDDLPIEQCEPPVSGACDNVPQCGCGSDNCEFDLDNTGATSCVAAGTTAPYATCSATEGECQPGYSCIAGLCKEFCSGEEPTCQQGPHATCHAVTANDEPIPEFFVCARTCDPRDPRSDVDGFLPCGPRVSCLPTPDGTSNCFVPTQAGAVGDSCDDGSGAPDSWLCGPGLGCGLDATGAFTCQTYCEVGSDDCGASGNCVPLSPSVFTAELQMGTCVYCDNVPPSGECSYYPQCGCDPGEMCSYGEVSSECVPATTRELNDECSPTERCGPGLDCLWLGDEQRGVCTQFCQDVAQCPNPNSLCLDLGLEGTNFCLWGCDPRNPTNGTAPFMACGAGQACVPVTDGDSLCSVPNQAVGLGGSCSYDRDCAIGLGCDFYFTCQPWCQWGDSDCASPSGSCFDRASATAAGEAFGFCSEAYLTVASMDADVPIPDLNTVSSTLTVPDPYSITRVTVEVTILHTYLADLALRLRAPNGTLITLVSERTLDASANLVSTRFDDSGTDLDFWTSPYTGAFAPETPLEQLAGLDAAGVWTLEVSDTQASDSGTISGWRLHFW